MLMLATKSRLVSIVAQGFGNDAFTDYGKDTILDDFMIPHLKNSNWVNAVYAFMEKADEYLELATAGKPFDIWIPDPTISGSSSGNTEQISGNNTTYYEEDLTMKYVIIVAVPVLIALIMCQVWSGQMKTAVVQRAAAQYVVGGGLALNEQSDTFTHRTETRRAKPKPQSTSSSSGGHSGGTTVSSSGRSGSSRSF